MKEQLISFETARLAKQKGFNEYCYNCYHGKGHLNTAEDNHFEIFSNGDIYTVAPTQSILQMWIWETHKIWVQSTPIFTANECIGISVTISSWKFPVITISYDGFSVSEGLEEGLYQALKLI